VTNRGFLFGLIVSLPLFLTVPAGAQQCTRTVVAKVVALDQPITFNRLGTNITAAMIFALQRDVVDSSGK